jgi:hypothetical protein
MNLGGDFNARGAAPADDEGQPFTDLLRGEPWDLRPSELLQDTTADRARILDTRELQRMLRHAGYPIVGDSSSDRDH